MGVPTLPQRVRACRGTPRNGHADNAQHCARRNKQTTARRRQRRDRRSQQTASAARAPTLARADALWTCRYDHTRFHEVLVHKGPAAWNAAELASQLAETAQQAGTPVRPYPSSASPPPPSSRHPPRHLPLARCHAVPPTPPAQACPRGHRVRVRHFEATEWLTLMHAHAHGRGCSAREGGARASACGATASAQRGCTCRGTRSGYATRNGASAGVGPSGKVESGE